MLIELARKYQVKAFGDDLFGYENTLNRVEFFKQLKPLEN